MPVKFQTPEKMHQIQSLICAGVSVRKVAEKLGCGIDTIYRLSRPATMEQEEAALSKPHPHRCGICGRRWTCEHPCPRSEPSNQKMINICDRCLARVN